MDGEVTEFKEAHRKESSEDNSDNRHESDTGEASHLEGVHLIEEATQVEDGKQQVFPFGNLLVVGVLVHKE